MLNLREIYYILILHVAHVSNIVIHPLHPDNFLQIILEFILS